MAVDLSALSLDGPVQIHVAPTVLAFDVRARQVFLGFSASEVGRAVRNRFPAGHTAKIGDLPALVGDLEGSRATGTIVIEPLAVPHPGGVAGLVWVVDRLLGPGGCPWDQAQTHESLKRHLIEEAYELIQAIDEQDEATMIEEIGDVLLQPLMHAQMEALTGKWDIDAVADRTTEKLIRRHPHVFGDAEANTPDEVLKNWDAIKKQEKGKKDDSILAGVPVALPALLRAFEVSKRAARCGFEWESVENVWEKLGEEVEELKAAHGDGDFQAIESEIGDVLFTVVNLARWMKIEPEDALRKMVNRFTERFKHMERLAGKPLGELSADEWDALWNKAKSVAN